MPISKRYLKIFKSMQKTYCTSEYGKDGIKDKNVQGISSCPKGRQVFYATMKDRGIDYTKLIISTDITPIIPKVFGTKKKTKKAKFRLLTLIELIVEHAKSHHNKDNKLHTQIVSELERRGYPHYETKLDVKPIKEDTDIEYVNLEDVIKAFPPAVVVEQSWNGFITGRIVNDCKIPKGYAIDLVVTQHPDVNIVHAIKTIKPTWLADMIHITFSNEPSVANNIPIYKKGFFKTSMKEQSKESFGKIKPFMKFASLNVKSGQDKYEFNDYTTFYNSWVSKYLDRGIIIQKKYNGRRFSIHKQGDKVQILTEDTRIDRSSEMPNITKELLEIKHDFVLDAIMVAYDSLNKEVKSATIKERDCEKIPIKDTAWANEGKISKEQELSMTFHVHDVLYFDGQAMNEKGYSDRLFELNYIIPTRAQFLSIAYWELVKTPIDLTHAMNRIIKENDSDGIIAKVADSKYNIKTGKENRAQEWSRFNFSNTLKEELSNFKFTTCSYHNEKWCPLEELSNALKDNKSVNLPVTCKLANIYKCYYIKNCFYEDGKNENTKKT